MVDWTTIAIVLPTLVVAYIIFGIAGFGTALVAAPVLAHAMPIASVVPLLALLDFGAATLNGFKLSDMKVLPLQSLSNAAAALKGETVDAALLPASTARTLLDAGGAKLLGWVGDETPWQLGAVFASPKTLADKPLVAKLLAALARAEPAAAVLARIWQDAQALLA